MKAVKKCGSKCISFYFIQADNKTKTVKLIPAYFCILCEIQNPCIKYPIDKTLPKLRHLLMAFTELYRFIEFQLSPQPIHVINPPIPFVTGTTLIGQQHFIQFLARTTPCPCKIDQNTVWPEHAARIWAKLRLACRIERHTYSHTRDHALSGTRAFINIFILIQFYFSTLYFIHNKSTVDRVFAFWSSIRPLPLASQSVLPTSSGLILAHGRIFRVVIS